MLEPVKVTYRCFLEKCSCGFRAVCIDLDLATESVTPDGAVKSLFDAMIGYLEVIRDGTATNERFWPYRKAPFWERLRYRFRLQFRQ